MKTRYPLRIHKLSPSILPKYPKFHCRFYTCDSLNTPHFFKVVRQYKGQQAHLTIPAFIQRTSTLRKILYKVAPYARGNYVHENFTYWLSSYAASNEANCLQRYFSCTANTLLSDVCEEFIKFCFRHKISLDKDKTLEAFTYHDSFSDKAVKGELLSKIKPKPEVNILGFGLGNGYYEKSIAEYLVECNLATSVKIFGFEPNPEPTEGIEFIAQGQLTDHTPQFDIVTARWVLHHVELRHRWNDFIKCINRGNSNAVVLVVEHGFLSHEVSTFDTKLYYLLNATFDIVANIGIRPFWFTSTAPNIGTNFYIHYLTPEDFEKIKAGIVMPVTQTIYDVGSGFPNQTICTMQLSKIL